MSDKETILKKYFKHPEDNPLRIMNTFNIPPSEIIPGLWIGNFYDSENEELIRNLNIGIVINLTGTVRKIFLGIIHLVVLVDQPFHLTRDSAIQAVDSIGRRYTGTGTMVHCLGGVDRAPTIVQKHLVKYYGWTPQQAEETIKKARPQALPHWDWWEQGESAPKGA